MDSFGLKENVLRSDKELTILADDKDRMNAIVKLFGSFILDDYKD